MLTIDEQKILSENEFKFLTCGCNSNIYKADNIVFKKYTSSASDKYRIKKDIFEELKKLDYDCFIKLYQIFLDEHNRTNSYTCNYIKETKEYFTKDDLNLILDNLDIMQNDFIYDISSKNILMDDPNTSNLLISEDKLIIIDPDCYYFSKSNDLDKNIAFNKETLLQYIYYKCILTTIREPSKAFDNIDGILDIDINCKTNLCKELKRVIK